jgi:hypothetical protein
VQKELAKRGGCADVFPEAAQGPIERSRWIELTLLIRPLLAQDRNFRSVENSASLQAASDADKFGRRLAVSERDLTLLRTSGNDLPLRRRARCRLQPAEQKGLRRRNASSTQVPFVPPSSPPKKISGTSRARPNKIETGSLAPHITISGLAIDLGPNAARPQHTRSQPSHLRLIYRQTRIARRRRATQWSDTNMKSENNPPAAPPRQNRKQERNVSQRRHQFRKTEPKAVRHARSPQDAQRNYERYLALARAEAHTGDRVAAENYLQHAEHYFRSMHQN